MFSSKYDQLLMGETSVKEACQGAFLPLLHDGGNLVWGRNASVCVCIHTVCLCVCVKEWKKMERERGRDAVLQQFIRKSTCNKIKEKSGGCKKKRKLSQRAIKEVAEWHKRGK